jgi:hypothetical protein
MLYWEILTPQHHLARRLIPADLVVYDNRPDKILADLPVPPENLIRDDARVAVW